MDTQEAVLRLTRHVRDAETYARVTDEVFVDGVNYGRLCVWHTFSRQLFTLLPACERSKMNILYKQKWWTLFVRSEWYNKLFLLVLIVVWNYK